MNASNNEKFIDVKAVIEARKDGKHTVTVTAR
jgi:hypothetical protein